MLLKYYLVAFYTITALYQFSQHSVSLSRLDAWRQQIVILVLCFRGCVWSLRTAGSLLLLWWVHTDYRNLLDAIYFTDDSSQESYNLTEITLIQN